MKPATEKQVSFLQKLLMERTGASVPTEVLEKLTSKQASERIDDLLKLPVLKQERKLEPGVYETPDGIYVVKPNREGSRLYAKKLVETGGVRLTASGEKVSIDFAYAPGAIKTICPEHKMDFERAKELTIRYGRCINCGRHLKDAKSVEAGIGPVCAAKFG